MLFASLTNSRSQTRLLRWLSVILVLLTLSGTLMLGWLLIVFEEPLTYNSSTDPKEKIIAFPLGVFPGSKTIIEQPDVDTFFTTHIGALPNQKQHLSWRNELSAVLAEFSWYQQLASPMTRTLVILPGERKEEVISHFAKIMGWDNTEKAAFAAHAGISDSFEDGILFPGKYIVQKDMAASTVGDIVASRFYNEVTLRYTSETATVVPLETALIIASLLEREAYDFTDMREISGVIWNRLFIDMKLQLDATLQYVRGGYSSSPVWWPRVRPRDKWLDSEFNTYQNNGLPPHAIANPSLDAILAALNPSDTDCLFYFHDEDADFHCSTTYEEHVDKLKALYGQGR